MVFVGDIHLFCDGLFQLKLHKKSGDFEKNFTQVLREFHSILQKISLSLKENFTQFLIEFHAIFKRISCVYSYK